MTFPYLHLLNFTYNNKLTQRHKKSKYIKTQKGVQESQIKQKKNKNQEMKQKNQKIKSINRKIKNKNKKGENKNQ